MKKFLMLHYGYEEPTPEIMAAWQAVRDGPRAVTLPDIGCGRVAPGAPPERVA